MTDWTRPDLSTEIRGYYDRYTALIWPHLADRLVRVGSSTELGSQTVHAITDLDYLVTLIATGAGSLAATAFQVTDSDSTLDRFVVHLRTGEGANIATAAMAAQYLAEQCEADGLTVIATTDGTDGLILSTPVTPGPAGDIRRSADVMAQALADRAPEIATTQAGQSQGRVFVDTSATSRDSFTPVPYSLVLGEQVGVIMPVTMDEVAAASAGMPLDPDPNDVTNRLAMWSDLTRALHRSSGGSD